MVIHFKIGLTTYTPFVYPHTMLFGTLDPIMPIAKHVVGMRVSHHEFLRAILIHSDFSEFHFFIKDTLSGSMNNEALFNLLSITENRRNVKVIFRSEIPRYLSLRNYTVFHRHDPKIDHLCYMRDRYSSSLFPITGTVHSLSYQRFQYDFFKVICANTYPFDSILCSSSQSKRVCRGLFSSMEKKAARHMDYPFSYKGRFDLMPFGVDTERFRPAVTEDKKAARKDIGLERDGIFILTISRFSQYSKMDLIPIIKKLAPLFLQNSSLYYILAGSDYESGYADKIQEVSASLGIGGRVKIIKNFEEGKKADLYRASDIFLSPSDNLQESFGLTLLEAMASGLPVIASNWNGYRDIVEDGSTGYLIDTIWADCTKVISDLAPISFEQEYHLAISQSVAVDLTSLYGRLKELTEDNSLRISMGRNARERAKMKFSWKAAAMRYFDLVKGLKRESDSSKGEKRGETDYLFSMNHFDIFKHYPSKTLKDSDQVCISDHGIAVISKRSKIMLYENMDHIIDIDLVIMLLQDIYHGGKTVGELKGMHEKDYPLWKILYSILWMIKHDFFKILFIPAGK